MSDAFDGHLSDSQEPEDLRELERRLDVDAALWSAGLPAAERAIERARQTPYMQTRSAVDTDRAVYIPASSPRVQQQALSTRGQTSMPIQRMRAFGAVAAAVVVVALLAALFTTFSGGRGHRTGAVGCGGASCATGATTPTIVVSPYSRYITNVTLANGVDSNGQPIGPTDSFLVNQQVFVVMRVDNPPPGQHTVAVRWFLGDSALQPPGSEKTSNTVNGSENVWFALNYTSPGKGTVRILWDPPAGDEGTNLSDPHIVATIDFMVYTTLPAATPAPGATPTASASPAGPQGPTPTPGQIPTPTPPPAG